jgi:isocitrate dehydrogenase
MNIVARRTLNKPMALKIVYDGLGSDATNVRWNLGTKSVDEKYFGDLKLTKIL